MTSANGQQFWCSVPAAPAVNASSTASFRGTADLEARKQLRAKGISRGVALIESLRGTCLYLRQGWFTYSFCYDQEVRQFHEVQRIGATRPVEDPNSDAYVLGQAPSLSPPPELQHPRHDSGNPTAAAAAAALARSAPETDEGETTTHTIQVFLGGGDLLGQGRENGMYLAQKWDGGTLCDKTGAPRQVEIQYHCNTETTDRIALVREVAICQYVMLIHTPRLCTEPLFLEGRTDEQDPENVIECRPVVDEATARMLLPAEPPLDTADAEQAAPETSIVLTGDAVEEAAPIISDNDALQGSSSDEPTELGEGEFETELVATIVYDPTTGEIVSTDTSATVLNNGNDAGHETEASNALQEEAANKALEEFIQKMRVTIADALRDRQNQGQDQGDAAQQQQQQQQGALFIPPGGLLAQQLQNVQKQQQQQPVLKRWTGSEDQQALRDALKKSYSAPPPASAVPPQQRQSPEEAPEQRTRSHDEL